MNDIIEPMYEPYKDGEVGARVLSVSYQLGSIWVVAKFTVKGELIRVVWRSISLEEV